MCSDGISGSASPATAHSACLPRPPARATRDAPRAHRVPVCIAGAPALLNAPNHPRQQRRCDQRPDPPPGNPYQAALRTPLTRPVQVARGRSRTWVVRAQHEAWRPPARRDRVNRAVRAWPKGTSREAMRILEAQGLTRPATRPQAAASSSSELTAGPRLRRFWPTTSTSRILVGGRHLTMRRALETGAWPPRWPARLNRGPNSARSRHRGRHLPEPARSWRRRNATRLSPRPPYHRRLANFSGNPLLAFVVSFNGAAADRRDRPTAASTPPPKREPFNEKGLAYRNRPECRPCASGRVQSARIHARPTWKPRGADAAAGGAGAARFLAQ